VLGAVYTTARSFNRTNITLRNDLEWQHHQHKQYYQYSVALKKHIEKSLSASRHRVEVTFTGESDYAF
jgi:hypothetical protein